MPVKITRAGLKYKVTSPGGTKAKATTKALAQSQKRLLNALEHGWRRSKK